ncbi:glycosyltransferase family 4 protein [Providencia stuartii]|nr:glycosyltransferase family 4 protein [Providencia stuartii]EMD5260127.1 glycosyltransferase family 4 protein [Providencia stuartii]
MKFQIITPEFGLEKGGIQSWAYYINKVYVDNNYDVNVFSYKEPKASSLMNLLRSFLSPQNYVLMTWKMSIFILPLFLFSTFAKFNIYIVFHGNDFLNLSKFQKKILLRIIKIKNVTTIANSCSIAEMFKNTFNEEIDKIIYPFMELPEVNKVANVNYHNEGNFKLCTITRLVKRKNIENVILAINELKKEKIFVSYVIGGKGPELSKLSTLILDLNLNDQIQIIGSVTEKNKWEIIKNSDAFILPSIFDEKDGSIEGYGIVYIEANAMGIPNISGNTGGAIEAVINNQTGIHTSGTVSSIKNAIIKCMNTSFSKKDILQHALKHDIQNRTNFP